MDIVEKLFANLAEEASEVAREAARALRLGPTSIYEPRGMSYLDLMFDEMMQVVVVLQVMGEYGVKMSVLPDDASFLSHMGEINSEIARIIGRSVDEGISNSEYLPVLLALIAERASRLSQVACKVLRFGAETKGFYRQETNAERVGTAVVDLLAVIELLNLRADVPCLRDDQLYAVKRRKLLESLEHHPASTSQ